MYILGAGLAGCLAGIRYQDAHIIEAAEGPQQNHFALLRFRSDAISRMTGIPMRDVIVDKFIFDGTTRDCTQSVLPRHIVGYSRKTNGSVSKRSIVNLDSDRRWIPPSDFHIRLHRMVEGRVNYGHKVQWIGPGHVLTDNGAFELGDGNVITTLPMPVNIKAMEIDEDRLDFGMLSRPIWVSQAKLDGYDLHMTVYFPDENMGVYRVTISGDTLIIESSKATLSDLDIECIREAFLITEELEFTIINKEQKNGKLKPINNGIRKSVIHEMTVKHGVYSLGRFACWRQILLDDVVKDIDKIHRMITTHPYDRNL